MAPTNCMRRAAVRPTAEAEHSAGRKRVAVRLETLAADAGTAMTQGESHDEPGFSRLPPRLRDWVLERIETIKKSIPGL